MEKTIGSIKELLSLPWSKHFWFSKNNDEVLFGDNTSFMKNDKSYENITFDIGNNRTIANMDVDGSIKDLTIFRSTYRANECETRFWPGVWLHKDYTCFGKYNFSLKIHDEIIDLSKANCAKKTGFIDNIFPITDLTFEDFKVTLITFSPISEDGKRRLSGIVYGANLEYFGEATLEGSVILPDLFTDNERFAINKWSTFRGDDFELSRLEGKDTTEVAFNLKKGESVWVPVGIYQPGDTFVENINEKGVIDWFNQTHSYFKNIIGELTIKDDSYLSEFFIRQILFCFEGIGMDDNGFIAGSNWGTNPTHNAIWIKDMFYSCLPFANFEPKFFTDTILWFAKYGVRHKGHRLTGGVTHSLSVSLTSIIFSGLYYKSTVDKQFFIDNPSLKKELDKVITTMIESRQKQDVFLYPSEFLSDGRCYGDWHTGTNVCAWYALEAMSILCDKVYNEVDKAKCYKELADKTKADIEKYCVVDGEFGKQYNEGVFVDGRAPIPMSDGEESDLTLIPFYGYAENDEAIYQNFMKFAMTDKNIAYNKNLKCIKWGSNPYEYPEAIIATAPGYLKGIAAISMPEEMHQTEGYMDNLRRVIDADGAIWWWPYEKETYKETKRGIIGKSNWASGVYVLLFINRFLGISFDAIDETLTVAPLAIKEYSWENMRFGKSVFDISYTEQNVTIKNKNDKKITVKLKLSKEIFSDTIFINGIKITDGKEFIYFNKPYIEILAEVLATQSIRITKE